MTDEHLAKIAAFYRRSLSGIHKPGHTRPRWLVYLGHLLTEVIDLRKSVDALVDERDALQVALDEHRAGRGRFAA